jgi:cytochrome P450
MTWQHIPLVGGADPDHGHFRLLTQDILGLLRRAADEGVEAPVRLAVGSVPFIMLNHPADVSTLLVDRSGVFIKPKLELWRQSLGAGQLTTEGSAWTRFRRRTRAVLTRAQAQRHVSAVVRHADNRIRRWPAAGTFDLVPELRAITLASSLNSLVGTEADPNIPLFTAALDTVMAHIQQREVSPPGTALNQTQERQFEAAAATLRSEIEALIAANPEGSPFAALREPGATDNPADATGLRDELLNLLVAGYESTATALAWTFALIAHHPETKERLQREIENVVGDRPPELADLDRMPYLQAVFTEALRLHPPSWGIMRATTRSCPLRDVRLPKGSCLLASQYMIHRNRRWFADPDVFRPQRWLDSGGPPVPRFAYFPFGAGRRACPGQLMARMTAGMMIARVLQQVRLIPAPGWIAEEAVHVTLHPKTGVIVQAKQWS